MGSGDYGCVRHFRAELPLDLAEGDLLDWRPFQEWQSNATAEAQGARDRRDATDPQGSWLAGQAPLAAWAGAAVQDAGFFVNPATGDDNLIVAAYNTWVVPPSGAGYGWDSAVGDLDRVTWNLPWQGSWEFSGGGAVGLATYPDCVTTVAAGERYDRILGTMPDAGAKAVYETLADGSRLPGTRACHLGTLGTGGMDVSVLRDTEQAWEILFNQTDEQDTSGKRAILYSEDGGESWMWDAAHVGGRAGFINTVPHPNELRCRDDYEAAGDPLKDYFWYGADASGVGDSFAMGTNLVGHPTAILAVSDRLALIAAGEACLNADPLDGNAGDCEAGIGGEGLWVVSYDPSAGMTYTKIENFEDVPSRDPSANATCDERHYFGFDSSTEIRVLADTGEYSFAGGTYQYFDVVIASRGGEFSGEVRPDRCGLRRVRWIAGDEAAATWDVVPYWADDPDTIAPGCSLSPILTKGLEVGANGDSVLLFGGDRNGVTAGQGGICEVRFDLTTSADYAVSEVIPPQMLSFAVEDLLAHPHVADVYFAVATQKMGCFEAAPPADCDPLGLYVVQRRTRPGALPTWGSKRISGDELECRQGMGLTWGTGTDPNGAMSDVYMGTSCGIWDGYFSW